MAELSCEQVRNLLVAADPPPPALSAHVASCRRCRGALVAVLAARYAVPPPTEAPTCAVMDELPAYLDLERTAGAATAAARFPQVWWHLWICPACAEEARLTRALLAAEEVGLLAAVPVGAAPSPARWPGLSLPRGFLHSAFAPQVALGAAWGEGDELTLIAEEREGAYRVALYAHTGGSDSWALSVVVYPPVRARAVLRFGDDEFRAPFDWSGTATVAAVPATLLTGRGGPPLEVSIEPDEP